MYARIEGGAILLLAVLMAVFVVAVSDGTLNVNLNVVPNVTAFSVVEQRYGPYQSWTWAQYNGYWTQVYVYEVRGHYERYYVRDGIIVYVER